MHRIGVGFSSSGLTPGEIAACVRLAEELGYESAWMAEGHAGDQFAILAAHRGEVIGAAGIALPIVTPRGGGPDPKARVVAALRACAP
mgnify:CR=1 FL=1